ncbi:hypothetical protein RSAG8_08996, partial [Rhizoctonia solani AG-8 WAC10335]
MLKKCRSGRRDQGSSWSVRMCVVFEFYDGDVSSVECAKYGRRFTTRPPTTQQTPSFEPNSVRVGKQRGIWTRAL